MDNHDYDISGSSYSSRMTEKTQQYKNFVRDAELLNRENGGRPSAEEANCYREASALCTQIINLNGSQQAVLAKWKLLKRSCEEEITRIEKGLAEERAKAEPIRFAVPETAPAPKEDPKEHRTASGFQSKNASEAVPAEVIETWYPKEFYMQKRNRLRQYPSKEIIRFSTVPGLEKTKALLREVLHLNWESVKTENGFYQIPRLLFYGVEGLDRSLIEAFINELRFNGYTFLFANGNQLMDKNADVMIRTLFREAVNQVGPCVLYIQNLDLCAESVFVRNPYYLEYKHIPSDAVADGLSDLMKAHKRVIVVADSEWPSAIQPSVLSMFHTVRLHVCSYSSREDLLQRSLGDCRLSEDLTIEEMVRRTRGFGRTDLLELVEDIRQKLHLDMLDSSPDTYWPEVVTREVFEEALESIKSFDYHLSRRARSYYLSQMMAFEQYRKLL